MNSAVWSRVAVLALTGAVLALFFTHAFFATSPVLIALQVLAALLMLWARVTFGPRSFHLAANPTEGGLITSGPYAVVRHPIYAAILLFLLAGIAAHPAWVTVGLGLVAVAGIAVRIFTEEQLVRVRFPEYSAYAARTRRLIPYVY